MSDQKADAAERTYPYRDVLRILGETFGADDKTMVSLKGRLKHYQGGGLVPPSRGKGREIQYTVSNIYDWGFALTLASLGLPPRFVLKNVRPSLFTDLMLPKIARAQDMNTSLYLIFYPILFIDALSEDADPMTWLTEYGGDRLESGIKACLDERKAFSIADLSDLKRRIDAAVTAIVG